jgi:hypothetical protein
MESWGVVFLGIIAATSVVQAAFLIGLAIGGRRLVRRVDELQRRVDHDIRPGIENLQRLTRNLAEISDRATLQARRAEEVVASALDRADETLAMVQRLVLRPLSPLVDVLAFIKGVRKGMSVFHQLGDIERERKGVTRRYTDDEHLFI